MSSRPRPFKFASRIHAIACPYGVDLEIPRGRQGREVPRHIRRAANWLRKLADWYDHRADQIENQENGIMSSGREKTLGDVFRRNPNSKRSGR